MMKLPELLAPAGSPDALCAAIEAGADAVYFGGESFSNRMRAKNFTESELKNAIMTCSTYGVSSYITMNTRLRDREMKDAVSAARKLYEAGATAFIVADIGLASLMRESMPSAELHASTQMTGVNSLDAEAIAGLGFSRMVCPRELSYAELCRLVKASPIEIEMFIHGAHCVSVSGQCLMSWAMGGRSGNRGECAQPCRLPYKCSLIHGGTHPLSLKDMCLARHIPEIIVSGAASLKIEGRLKSADYVYGVTKIYRTLLDERRAATEDEVRSLDAIFSRDGFTDGYFKRKYFAMTGMRPENAVSEGERFSSLTRKVPLSAHVRLKVGESAFLTVSDGSISVSAEGDAVQEAKSAPVTHEGIYKNLSKLGTTVYSLDKADFTSELEGDIFLASSQVNELRRRAVAELEEQREKSVRRTDARDADFTVSLGDVPPRVRSASFADAKRIPREAYEYFDIIFLSDVDVYRAKNSGKCEIGLDLPAWCADSDKIREKLHRFAEADGKHVLCHTLGQIRAALSEKLIPTASVRLNLTCSKACEVLSRMGAHYLTLSPELGGAAVRDIAKLVPSVGAVVYGKLPLMLLRRCIMSDSRCSGNCGGEGCLLPTVISDRRGVKLSVMPMGDRVNVITNPIPIYTADKLSALGSIATEHFIFTDESEREIINIIDAYKRALTPEDAGMGKIKRM